MELMKLLEIVTVMDIKENKQDFFIRKQDHK